MSDLERIQQISGGGFFLGIALLIISILLYRGGGDSFGLGANVLRNTLGAAVMLIVIGGLGWLGIEFEWYAVGPK